MIKFIKILNNKLISGLETLSFLTGIKQMLTETKVIFYGIIILLTLGLLTLSKCSHPPEVIVDNSPDNTPVILEQSNEKHEELIVKSIKKEEVTKQKVKVKKKALTEKIIEIKNNNILTPQQKDAIVASAQIDALNVVYEEFYGTPTKVEVQTN